ncbi:MAG: hypothetical protein HYV09_17865 [Deltaproteobacteria bacterium]|nr:hypothetical protein [Deltaproteobacteria bacterium]
MGKKKPAASRGRTERRALDREVRKQLESKERLARLSSGGAPERPIEVATASLVEPMARASRCVRCDGAVRLDEHVVRVVAEATRGIVAEATRGIVAEATRGTKRSLRVARVSCPSCGAAREIYFAIVAPVLH